MVSFEHVLCQGPCTYSPQHPDVVVVVVVVWITEPEHRPWSYPGIVPFEAYKCSVGVGIVRTLAGARTEGTCGRKNCLGKEKNVMNRQ